MPRIVEKITDVPILGELPLSKKPEKGSIVVQENQNGMMEEAFRWSAYQYVVHAWCQSESGAFYIHTAG